MNAFYFSCSDKQLIVKHTILGTLFPWTRELLAVSHQAVEKSNTARVFSDPCACV